jgi:hypothetical protein
VEIEPSPAPDAAAELAIYLRVWKVLYPDAEVQVENGEGELPAA